MKFWKLFGIFFLLTISMTGIVIVANAEQSDKGITLTFSHVSTPGLSHRDGSGTHDKLVRKMCERAKITCEFIYFEIAVQALRRANAGEVDGTYPRLPAIENKALNLRRIPENIGERRLVAFARADTKIVKVDWSRACDLHPAFPRGWEMLQQGLGQCETHFAVPDPTELFELLLTGKAGIVVSVLDGGQQILRAKGLSGIRILEPPFGVSEAFLYLHQKHAPILTERLAKVLREIKSEEN